MAKSTAKGKFKEYKSEDLQEFEIRRDSNGRFLKGYTANPRGRQLSPITMYARNNLDLFMRMMEKLVSNEKVSPGTRWNIIERMIDSAFGKVAVTFREDKDDDDESKLTRKELEQEMLKIKKQVDAEVEAEQKQGEQAE